MLLIRTVVFLASMFVGLSAASAAPPCNSGHVGTSPDCPILTAPATTAVPGPSTDGSMFVQFDTATTLFNNAVPPNGFMVQTIDTDCFVTDNGTNVAGNGFSFGPSNGMFVTPQGYKPVGLVSVLCGCPAGPGACAGKVAFISARGW